MKAIVREKYGEAAVLELKEIPKPQVAQNEVLIKVLAASLNKADWHLMTGTPFPLRFSTGIFKPKNIGIGADFAGMVEQVGSDVKQFKVGDEVYGELPSSSFGSLAEYVCTIESVLAKKPNGISFEESAAIPLTALTALQGLRNTAQLKEGMKLLINGASGGVGSYAIQIAKNLGAHVTAVCSTAKLEQAKRLRADEVIDYTIQDFTTVEKKYDAIFDMIGNHRLRAISKVLKKGGKYACGAAALEVLFKGWWYKLGKQQSMKIFLAKPNRADLQTLTKWLEEGSLKAVIEKTYTLDDAPEAMQKLSNGGLKGKLVIVM
tara:strand:- start:175 stop:1131 length:957 start_codon:yes stop_codon:yes gene_type:complete